MDRGAARSRKRAAKLDKGPATASSPAVPPQHNDGSRLDRPQGWNRDNATAGPSRARGPLPSQEDSRPRKNAAPLQRPKKIRKEITDDPNQYKPKAIRNSTALIYATEQFAIPPTPERLKGVTRIDLAGSDCSDVTWLEGTEVTWLSLKGCPVVKGWDAVGTLKDLAGTSLVSPVVGAC